MQTTRDTVASTFDEIGAAPSAAWETIDRLLEGFLGSLPLLAVAAVVFAAFWGAARLVRAAIHRASRGRGGTSKSNVGLVLGRLAYFATVVLGLFVAAVIVFPTFTFGSLLSVLGVGGVAIGFAFKDIFQNLLAGILILLQEPFRVGDEITAGTFTGTVESIETRATFIRTYDGRRVIVPNALIYTDPVIVISAYNVLRSEYDVGIGYGDDIGRAKEILLEVVRATEGVLAEPAPDVLVWDLAGSSVNLRLRWWSRPTRRGVVDVRDHVLQNAKESLSAAGIDLPFPTTQVLLHDQTEATDGDRARQREGWPRPASGSLPRPRPIAAQPGAAQTAPDGRS